MWVVSTEDKYIASNWGAAVRLEANKPKEVGNELGLLCLQEGCQEVKDGGSVVKEEVSVKEEVAIEESSPDFNSMTKIELEEYGRTIGIELDRRKKKADLIAELEAV